MTKSNSSIITVTWISLTKTVQQSGYFSDAQHNMYHDRTSNLLSDFYWHEMVSFMILENQWEIEQIYFHQTTNYIDAAAFEQSSELILCASSYNRFHDETMRRDQASRVLDSLTQVSYHKMPVFTFTVFRTFRVSTSSISEKLTFGL